MLVLSRKLNERIVVGGSVVVTVVRISGDKVRLGIEAPDDVRVIRDEIADQEGFAELGVAKLGVAEGSGLAEGSSEGRCFVA